jgi:hypothetical protein
MQTLAIPCTCSISPISKNIYTKSAESLVTDSKSVILNKVKPVILKLDESMMLNILNETFA